MSSSDKDKGELEGYLQTIADKAGLGPAGRGMTPDKYSKKAMAKLMDMSERTFHYQVAKGDNCSVTFMNNAKAMSKLSARELDRSYKVKARRKKRSVTESENL